MERHAQVPRCAICGTAEQLLRCAKCKTIYYCSTAHQHMDWPLHKQKCRLLAKQKSNNKMLQLQAVAANAVGNTVPMHAPAASMLHGTNGFVGGQGISVDASVGVSASGGLPVVDAGILTAVQPTSVILGTHENEIMNGQAETVSQNQSMGYHGNVETNSTVWSQSLGGTGAGIEYELPPQQGLKMDQRLLPQFEHFQQNSVQQQQQLLHQPHYQSGQNEKSISCQIGRGDENAIGNANERRYEELCRNIINDMNQYGLSVVDDFLGRQNGIQVLDEVHKMYSTGVFKDGQLANNLIAEQQLHTIRGDKITWVKGIEPGCSNVGYLINQIDAVISRANSMKNNGKLGNYNIKERTKAMVACYPGSGSHYVMHVDNPNKDGRVITAIYYLNLDWDTQSSGGILRIFPEHNNTVADIEPKFDRLIFFWSDKRNPHEVQPAHQTRYAITVWYFDANEREAALNRCKYNSTVQTMGKNALSSTMAATVSSAMAPGLTPAAAAAVAVAAGTTNANTNIKKSEICT